MLQALNRDPALSAPLLTVPPLAQALIDANREGRSLTEAFTSIVFGLGFDSFTYGFSTVARPMRDSRMYVWTNAPHEWIGEYERNGYIEVDPRATITYQHSMPYFWDARVSKAPKVRQFLQAAAVYGIGSGITIGLYLPTGTSGFWFNRRASLWTPEDKEAFGNRLPELQMLASFAHDYLRHHVVDQHRPAMEGAPLSPREREVLQWIARGKHSHEIASILGISETTVLTYVRQTLTKMGVATRGEAVAKAVSMGLIDR